MIDFVDDYLISRDKKTQRVYNDGPAMPPFLVLSHEEEVDCLEAPKCEISHLSDEYPQGVVHEVKFFAEQQLLPEIQAISPDCDIDMEVLESYPDIDRGMASWMWSIPSHRSTVRRADAMKSLALYAGDGEVCSH